MSKVPDGGSATADGREAGRVRSEPSDNGASPPEGPTPARLRNTHKGGPR